MIGAMTHATMESFAFISVISVSARIMQHDDLENGDELLLEKVFNALDVARAALDDVAGRMLGVPLPRQAFNVVEEPVARGLDERFARFGVEHVRAIAQQRRDETRQARE